MAATPTPEQVAALFHALRQLFGTCLIGFTLGTTLYGVSVLQTFIYFRLYTKDHWFLKSTVNVSLVFVLHSGLLSLLEIASLWTLDTLTTIFVAHSLYVYFVLNFGEDPTVNLVIPWSFVAEKFLVTVITFIAQLFYARTIWKVSAHKIVVFCIVALAIASFGLGIVTTVHLFQDRLVTSIAAREFSLRSADHKWPCPRICCLNDIIITVALCYFLHIHRSAAIASTGQLIDSLILYAVSRGVLTAITQIMFLVLNVGLPHDTYWQPFHQVVGKLYVNSVLATLNVRKRLNATEDSGTVGLPEFHARTTDYSTDIHTQSHPSLHSASMSLRPKANTQINTSMSDVL
ncbi:hypothetical protein BDZ89DRAFT_1147170 [Hymenopellis radicata]|nr:hypothetical protein BDZ89DRAFT_1147170 [Hymenopellis radicata]